jgi:hypothetical protein
MHCEWFRLYDILEDVFSQLLFHEQELADPEEEPRAYPLQKDLNEYFRYAGIGWQMIDGHIVSRGDDAFESVVRSAQANLEESGRRTAAQHLSEAIQALSRRPDANCPGAMYHAMGALECVARDLTGEPKHTLGQILKRRPELLPPPLDQALSQIWVCVE